MAHLRCLTVVGFALSILGLLVGCTTSTHDLLPESEIEGLPKLASWCEALNQGPVVVESEATPDGVLKLEIHEYRKVEKARVLVAIHGVLSCQGTWRYLIGALGEEYEIWAVNMPGCGGSSAPAPGKLSEDAYSPDWMAKYILGALEKRLEARPDVESLTFLSHSLGGGVTLRMLGSEEIRDAYPEVLAKVDGAILLAPLNFGIARADEKFEKLALLSDFETLIGDSTGMTWDEVVKATLAGAGDPKRVPLECAENLHAVLTDLSRVHAMKAMLRRAIPLTEDDTVDWTRVYPLIDDYRRISVPCLIIWGESDDTLPALSGYQLDRDVKDSRFVKFRGVKHSVHIEQPRLTAKFVSRFLESGTAAFPDLVPSIEPSNHKFSRLGDAGKPNQEKQETTTRLRSGSVMRAPSTVSDLSGEDVRRSGARKVSDALRMLPGIEVQRTSPTESAVAIRGYLDTSAAAQGVLGTLDGRQVYNQFLGNVLWDQIPVRLEDIEKIEVVRGPGSFLHGPNAMHGVLQIWTKAPLDYLEGDYRTVSSYMGSYGSVMAGATLVNRTENTGFRISAQYEDIGRFDDDRDDSGNKAFFEAAYEIMLGGNPHHVLGIAGGYSHQKFETLLPEVQLVPATSTASEGQELFTRVEYKVGDPKRVRFEGRFSWTGMDARAEPIDYYQPFDLNLDTMDIDGLIREASGPHTYLAGAGYRHSSFGTSDEDVSDGSHSVDQAWLFAQAEFAITGDVDFTLGARVDVHSEAGTDVSPRAAVVWEFVPNHNLRVSAGRGFRAPSLRELWFDMQVTGVPGVPATLTVGGNEDLNPECLTSFELGYRGAWNVTSQAGQGGTLETLATTYYNIIDDLISYETDPSDPLRVIPMNQDDEVAYGVELEGRYWFSRGLSVQGNYSYAVREDRDTGERNLIAPLHKLTGGVTWSLDRFETMVWADYYGSSEMAGDPIDSQFLVNGSVSYVFDMMTPARARAFIRFMNLFDTVHREHPDGDEFGRIMTVGLQIDW